MRPCWGANESGEASEVGQGPGAGGQNQREPALSAGGHLGVALSFVALRTSDDFALPEVWGGKALAKFRDA